jgi:hypothetical protein
MSHTQRAVQSRPGDAQLSDEQHNTGRNGKGEFEGTDGSRRRWYHLRPEPRRRTDLMGFNSMLWMAVGWLIVILLVAFPFPWWW